MTEEEFDEALKRAENDREARLADVAEAVANHKGPTIQGRSGVEVLEGILDARGWDLRTGQVQMTQSIDDANSTEDGEDKRVGVVAVVAPVGTGKTLGYLASALARGERVIIATSTKALQDQIVGEELPRLREDMFQAYGKHITFAVMKGKANYACLGGETRVITRDGTAAIASLAGTTATVLDGRGEWVEAPIKEYGKQRLYRITLTGPGEQRRVVRATAEHRWFTNNDINSPGFAERVTADLRPGDRLAYAGHHPIASQMRPSQFGIAHGIVFGDGTVFGTTKNGFRTGTVVLYGGKRELTRYFSESEQRETSDAKHAEPYVRVCDLPNGFKELPSLDEAPSYLYGWLAGYCATDGHVSKSGTVTLFSSKRAHVEFVETVCHRLGIATYGVNGGVRGEKRRGLGSADGELFSVSLNGKTLGPDFYLRSRHREQNPEPPTKNMTNYKRWLRARRWVVASIEPDSEETVYCAEVPSTQSFVLEGNILTGNCLSHIDQTIARFTGQLGAFADADLIGQGSGDQDLDLLHEIRQSTKMALAAGDVAKYDNDLLLQRLSPDTRRGVTAKHACPARRIDLNDTELVDLAEDHSDVWRAAYCQAMLADIVVMNTALLVEEVIKQNNKVNPTTASIIEGVGMVVIDEAHHAPNIVTEAFSARVTRSEALKAARAVDKRTKDEQFSDATLRFLDAVDHADENIAVKGELHQEIGRQCAAFTKAVNAAVEYTKSGGKPDAKFQEALADFREEVVDKVGAIREIAERRTKRGDVELYSARLSVDFNEDGTDFTLAAVPVDVSFFRDRLVSAMVSVGIYSVPPVTPKKTIVLCSGTMSASVPRLLGLGGGDVMRSVESPFDPRRARLCIPSKLPVPSAPGYEDAAWAAAEKAIRAANGRTLFLCTSRRAVDAFYARAQSLPFTVLRQDEAPRGALIGRFQEDEHSILVATMGYWEGIDVPGSALSLVVIDKVPFPVPTDTIATARREWVAADGGNAFMIVDVGHASTMLAQGSGRLIRSEADSGGVLILDSRLVNSKYGSAALSQIESQWLMYREIEPFAKWMETVAQAHQSGEPDDVLDYRVDTQPVRPKARRLAGAR